MVSPLFERPSCFLHEESTLDTCLSFRKLGSLGWGRAVSLLNIKTTLHMVGLCSKLFCTHNRPTWIDRNTSVGLHESLNELSISSNGLSSLNSLHAWKDLDNLQNYGNKKACIETLKANTTGPNSLNWRMKMKRPP